MPNKDLRKEQVALLRFENTLKTAARTHAAGKGFNKGALVAGAAAVAAMGVAAAAKLGDPALAQYAEQIEAAATQSGENMIIALADAASRGHAAFESAAKAHGFGLLTDGGRPKPPVAEIVVSLLGRG